MGLAYSGCFQNQQQLALTHGLTEPLFLRITRSIKEEYTEETTMAAIKETYYDILHIQKAAGDADIKRAYRKLAMKWHPDKNPDKAEEAAKRFQEIGEAYDVLNDPEKRAIYDQFGYEGLKNGVPGDAQGKGGYAYKENAQEIFEGFFGTGNPFSTFGFGETAPFSAKLNKPGPKKEDPIFYNLDCSLAELYNGCIKKFNVTRKRFSPEGEAVEEAKVLTIGVKPGWKKGTKITFPCEGDEVVGGISADIIFVIQESGDEEAVWIREGHNLIYTYKLNLADALTDCSLQIPTLDNRTISIACPEVVSPFYEKTVIGEGMPISKKPGTKGDLIIKFHILFPKYLNGTKKLELRKLLGPEETLN